MRRKHFPVTIPWIAGLLSGLLFAILAVPLGAQTAPHPHPYYDATRETTLKGEVSDVIAKPTASMIPGYHLVVSTSSGALDASLGTWGLRGMGAPSISAGQQVELTGVMKSLRNQQVFLVRLIKVDGQVYTMRNQHGIPVSPQSRQRTFERTAQKGASL